MAFLSGVYCSYRCHHKLCPNTEDCCMSLTTFSLAWCSGLDHGFCRVRVSLPVMVDVKGMVLGFEHDCALEEAIVFPLSLTVTPVNLTDLAVGSEEVSCSRCGWCVGVPFSYCYDHQSDSGFCGLCGVFFSRYFIPVVCVACVCSLLLLLRP
jgi:hypothetical protein